MQQPSLEENQREVAQSCRVETGNSAGQCSPRREPAWSQSSSISSRDQVCIQSYPQWHHKYYQRLQQGMRASIRTEHINCRVTAAFLFSPSGIWRNDEGVRRIPQMLPKAVKFKVIFSLRSSKVGGLSHPTQPSLSGWISQECDANPPRSRHAPNSKRYTLLLQRFDGCKMKALFVLLS